jgi:hypothetical protein
VGSGYQIAQKGSYILQNEDGYYLCRRKTLAALKLELEARLASDRRQSELDCALWELRQGSTKAILDTIVGLLNTLVVRHVIGGKPAPDWFIRELKAIDFTANTMQSAIDQPEDEDVSFAH